MNPVVCVVAVYAVGAKTIGFTGCCGLAIGVSEAVAVIVCVQRGNVLINFVVTVVIDVIADLCRARKDGAVGIIAVFTAVVAVAVCVNDSAGSGARVIGRASRRGDFGDTADLKACG